jgi:hypothetical protein
VKKRGVFCGKVALNRREKNEKEKEKERQSIRQKRQEDKTRQAGMAKRRISTGV